MPKPLRDNPPDASNVAPKTIEIKAPRTQGRRQFSAAEKLRIVRAADACAHGELGALLRREGIYQTLVAEWAKARGAQRAGRTYRRDRKPRSTQSHEASRAVKLETENARLTRHLIQMQAALDVMSKALRLLELLSDSSDLSQPAAGRK